jgi:thiamine biosynthesis lipoprotein
VIVIEECMGTVFTIDVRDPGQWEGAVGDAMAWLHHVDAVFSTYDDGSDISRIQRGELQIGCADPDVAPVLELGARMERETHGFFSIRWNGQLDPTGLVKGWAIERASEILRNHGSMNHAVNGGGDIQAAGEAAPGRSWTIGISDPFDATKILTTVKGRDFAIATSGAAERGLHIVNPRTGRPADELAGVSVIGRSLTCVDAYATAAAAMGHAALQWIEGLPGYDAVVVGWDVVVVKNCPEALFRGSVE